MTELKAIGSDKVLKHDRADVGRAQERIRQARIARAALFLAPIVGFLVTRMLAGQELEWGLPGIPDSMVPYIPAVFLVLILGLSAILPLIGMGKSPHVMYRPEEISVTLDDVRGSQTLVDEVVKTLNLFLAHKTFEEQMGGNARKAILFEGPPGTGKTYMAKAMAAEAGVPFLFVSSSAFQSQFYGATNRKIRSFFRELRKLAEVEGGAIGFIEEIDAIGAARSGMGSGAGDGMTGVVNELLIQMQSFDEPIGRGRLRNYLIEVVNRWLPPHAKLTKRKAKSPNILVIGATNRAADLDPALLRPGRFDRSIFFDLPTRAGRRDIIDYYLAKKAHDEELDDETRRATLAAITHNYSPVMLEHLFDEALMLALRRGANRLSWVDIQRAKMTEEIGLAQPVEYTDSERLRIATHESGHATIAYFLGVGRKLEVLSIIKRKEALGLLAHSDLEERFTKTQTELEALIAIAFGGMVAEDMFFGEISSGVAGDLQYATTAAAQMVGSLGMSGSLISLEAAGPGRTDLVTKVLNTDAGKEQVEKILRAAKMRASSILNERRHVVEALRDALLEKNELIGDDIVAVIEDAGSHLVAPERRRVMRHSRPA